MQNLDPINNTLQVEVETSPLPISPFRYLAFGICFSQNSEARESMDPNRVEAERLLGIAEKLLHSRDLSSCRDFAILAQETEPLLEGSDQILAVADVLLAADKRVNNHPDWYAVLLSDRRSDDLDHIKKSYRRLALLLHPDKNKYAYAEHAFKLVADAWAVLSDPAKKQIYDNELGPFSRIDLGSSISNKLPVRRDSRARTDAGVGNDGQQQPRSRLSTFWTTCPYCYVLYEYPRVYESCCLRCQNCKRGFEAVVVPNLPPVVQGQEAYYCCWGFFPMGFVGGSGAKGKSTAAATAAFPNWMPPVFTTPQSKTSVTAASVPPAVPVVPNSGGVVDVSDGTPGLGTNRIPKKRGRPKKYA
ncbi:uncharacterized protein LOC126604892 [Malus sylvestris]|uniref:uncharacterized protein LOC126604892 n=1 Tax=Malus sylvestris TaxID=3752 RepID=UPI0021AC2035|nr:uncharacterized protein LOC126604892 [Malus sylvestris]